MSVQLPKPHRASTPRPAEPPLQVAPDLHRPNHRGAPTLGMLPLLLGFAAGAAVACFVISFFIPFY
jgi:hypothetical protein